LTAFIDTCDPINTTGDVSPDSQFYGQLPVFRNNLLLPSSQQKMKTEGASWNAGNQLLLYVASLEKDSDSHTLICPWVDVATAWSFDTALKKFLQLITQNLEFKDQARIFEVRTEEVSYSESANTATAW